MKFKLPDPFYIEVAISIIGIVVCIGLAAAGYWLEWWR